MPLVLLDVAIEPLSLSAAAAELLAGVASAPLSFFLLGATGRTGLPFCRRRSRVATS